MRKDLEIIFTALFWMSCSLLTRAFCLPLYHSWHPYVRTGRQIVLKASRHWAKLRPQMEFPRICSAFSDARVLLHMTSTWRSHHSLWWIKKPRYQRTWVFQTRCPCGSEWLRREMAPGGSVCSLCHWRNISSVLSGSIARPELSSQAAHIVKPSLRLSATSSQVFLQANRSPSLTYIPRVRRCQSRTL